MTKLLKYCLFALVLTFGTTTMAHAHCHPDPPPPGKGCNPAPEVDPGMAMSGLTLLGGAIAVVRSRRQ